MNTLECITTRRSIREFEDKKINPELVQELIEYASCSPSWKNTQIVRYIGIENEALKTLIATDCVCNFTHNSDIIKKAPLLLVMTMKKGICGFEKDGSYSTSKTDHWQMFDCGIAAQTFSLAAWEKGLGSVILGIFDTEKINSLLNLPDNMETAALIAVGYPAVSPNMPKRKAVDELFQYLP
jgi:nitroreductase